MVRILDVCVLPQLQVWLHVACCPAATEQYVVVSAALPTPRWFKHSLACSWCPPPHLNAHPLCIRVVAILAECAYAANSEAGGRLESTAVNAGQSAAGLNIASRGGVSAQRTWFSQHPIGEQHISSITTHGKRGQSGRNPGAALSFVQTHR